MKVRSGIIPAEINKKTLLVAKLEYQSIWDIWYRFKRFVIFFYDLDSQQILFAAGQGRDNVISNEDVVIRDTFRQIRDTLRKN